MNPSLLALLAPLLLLVSCSTTVPVKPPVAPPPPPKITKVDTAPTTKATKRVDDSATRVKEKADEVTRRVDDVRADNDELALLIEQAYESGLEAGGEAAATLRDLVADARTRIATLAKAHAAVTAEVETLRGEIETLETANAGLVKQATTNATQADEWERSHKEVSDLLTVAGADYEKLAKANSKLTKEAATANVYRNWVLGIAGVLLLIGILFAVIKFCLPGRR